jgi:integrase
MASVKRYHEHACSGGSCACPYRLDYRPLGTSGPRKRLFFPTKKAAEKHLSQTVVKVDRGEYLELKKLPTFAQAAELWYESKTDRRASHVADLRTRLDKHILPPLGTLRLDKITVAMIEKLRNDLRADEYAPRTINTIVRIIGSVFRAAIRRGEIARNPVDQVERAFMAAGEIGADDNQETTNDSDAVNPDSVLSPDEIRALLQAATPGYYRILFTTAYISGMRSGELLALKWGDVQFTSEDGRGKVFVRRSLSWARADRSEPVRPRFYPPKTKAGLRSFTIAPELVSTLKTWKLQCPHSDLDLVFPHVDGQPNNRDRILTTGLYPALRRAGLRRVTFHSLRHSCASALVAAGAPVTEVQHRLGHASAAITLKVYTHWFKGTDTGAADRLASVITPQNEIPKKWAKSGHRTTAKATVPTENPL